LASFLPSFTVSVHVSSPTVSEHPEKQTERIQSGVRSSSVSTDEQTGFSFSLRIWELKLGSRTTSKKARASQSCHFLLIVMETLSLH
jgi:pilus assembly protein TadC